MVGMSPTIDALKHVLIPHLKLMGVDVKVDV